MRVGRYQLGEEIARGGTGAVFRARDQAGRSFAVKLLHSRNPVHLRRFLRETQALVRIQHPNVIRIHDVGEAGGTPYLVMDLVDGDSLQDRIEQRGLIAGAGAATLMLSLTRAVQHAHESGILHRDIKPANVLLPADGGPPILTDFGLARDLAASRSSLSKTGTFLGTPGYWPPEQARGDLADIGPPSDVYALGATLYAMLTGQPPFTGQSLIELLGSTCTEPPTPPSQLVENVDRALERICLRCLEKDPARRYPTAAALAEALEAYLEGRSDGSSLSLPLALGAAALILLAVLLAVLAQSRSRASAPQTPPQKADASSAPAPPASDTVAVAELTKLVGLLKRAEALDKAKDWPALKPLCDQALALEPDHVEALRLRSRARAHLGDTPGAIADLDHALKLAPRRGILHTNRGLCQVILGRNQEAVEDFSRGIRYDPSNAKAYAGRALARIQLQDLDGAVADATAATDRDPKLAQAWIYRGNAHHAKGTLEAAEADFTEAITIEPTNLQALHNRGMARVGLGRFQPAVDDFNAALEAHPKTGFVFVSRGMARERMQNDRGAVADYRAALETLPAANPARKQVRLLLGAALRRLGAR